ncbi:flagellar biosynthesis protein FlhA [Candidatus Dependentiae bacterium]|nr:flagellar biosynthesis protein FlhA [Candidatus Dependentiae bacterium]
MAAASKVEEIPLQKLLKNGDLLVALGVIAIVIMLVIPIYTWMLNVLLTISIAIGLIIILSVTYLKKPADFSIFPSLLLITTLFRLALNVSSTRLILLEGRQGVEGVITAFGDFVVGGNYIVGIVIFLILVIIQFMVIVKGSTRVAEVAARFTLDAMPGKQMAIDADLNSGAITEQEADKRRKEIRREADFYGAMDGASKFISGDVIAGLIITVINILGGWAIGVWMRQEALTEAAKTYTLLTIGDGLVAQIPALLISVATGIIVTRAASDNDMGSELTSQLTQQPKVLYITAGALLGLGIFTPLPTLPMSVVAVIIGGVGFGMSGILKNRESEDVKKKSDSAKEEVRQPENVASLIQVDTMELEIGYGLIPLVAPEQGGDLLERITLLRRQSALDYGIIVPPIRIRDNMQLRPNAYVIKIKGVEIAGGEVYPDKFLAMNPGNIAEKLQGIETIEPAFGLPATWITDNQREQAELLGYTVVDPPSIIATHLTEIIKRNAHELLDRKSMNTLLAKVKEEYAQLVDEVIPTILSISDVQKVLQYLLKEGIPIKNLPAIFEILADKGRTVKDPRILTEYVRLGVSRQICSMLLSQDGRLNVITLSPQLEKELADNVRESQEGNFISLDPVKLQRLLSKLGETINTVVEKGLQPVILVAPNIRPYFKDLTERTAPGLIVLSYNEIVSNVEVQAVGMVTM